MTKLYVYKHKEKNTLLYRRRIPKDLIPVFGKTVFQMSLETDDMIAARGRSLRVTRQLENNFELARQGEPILPIKLTEDRPPASRRERALDLIERFIDVYEDHRQLDANTMNALEDALMDHGRDENLNVIPERKTAVTDAFTLLKGEEIKEDWPISMVKAKYLEIDDRRDSRKFVNMLNRSVEDWIEFAKDKPLSRYRKFDVLAFVRHYDERGLARDTAKKRISMLRAAINKVNDAFDVNLNNPFVSVKIEDRPDERKKEQKELDINAWEAVKEPPNTDVKLLARILYATGCRVSEITGMRVDEVDLSSNIPHISVEPNGARRLKNKASIRKIPLVGVGLDAMREVIKNAGDNEYLFSRWIKNGKATDTPSNSVKKSLGINCHTFRHSLTTRMRDAEVDFNVMQAILGHTSGTITERYGSNELLRNKLEALTKVVET